MAVIQSGSYPPTAGDFARALEKKLDAADPPKESIDELEDRLRAVHKDICSTRERLWQLQDEAMSVMNRLHGQIAQVQKYTNEIKPDLD